LQISTDERARVGRVATQFSEEDLARFLQIMLRTFDELGYRQEQRFHLELGVLKLVHAQRMLPLEQILSQVAPEAAKPGEPSRPAPARSPVAAPVNPPESGGGSAQQRSYVSPFEADRARKERSFDPELSAGHGVQGQALATAAAVAVEEPEPASDPGVILGHVLAELEKAGHKMLASTLESGSVALDQNQLVVTISQPASVIDVMMSSEPRKLANAAASAATGRMLRVNVVSGVPASNGAPGQVLRPRDGANARSRAAEDPVVQRMRERFGAEIRTVIDHRAKN